LWERADPGLPGFLDSSKGYVPLRLNLYGYGAQKPLFYSDPDGRDPWKKIAGLVLGGLIAAAPGGWVTAPIPTGDREIEEYRGYGDMLGGTVEVGPGLGTLGAGVVATPEGGLGLVLVPEGLVATAEGLMDLSVGYGHVLLSKKLPSGSGSATTASTGSDDDAATEVRGWRGRLKDAGKAEENLDSINEHKGRLKARSKAEEGERTKEAIRSIDKAEQKARTQRGRVRTMADALEEYDGPPSEPAPKSEPSQ
jgi:hypothetical protein